MTTRYVGIGGNDSNDGLSWANRKLTLNGVEDTPVEAGDTVYVGAGTYRELLTCDVDGSSGSPITYIGDYDGSHTDGTGGVIRITGSNDDQSAARNNCIAINKSYRTFTGFLLDGTSAYGLTITGGKQNITIDKCYIEAPNYGIYTTYILNSVFSNLFVRSEVCIYIYDSATLRDDTNNSIQNCIIISQNRGKGVHTGRHGGITVKNNVFFDGEPAIFQQVVLNTGQSVNAYNNIFYMCKSALTGASTDCLIEDYNTLYACDTARTNVDTGAHSVTYPPLFDTRWFFEMVNGGSMLTPFDLASYSQLINVAGTSPTTADMRGTTVQGTQREWGALEYDSTLDIEAGSGTGTSSVKILPFTGKVGL